MWRLRARGRSVKTPGTMNRTEARYAQHLSLRQKAGEIEWFAYEAIKLRLAAKTFLTVDFFVMLTGGELEAHELKGVMEDDAAVKLKVAAAMYPFRFLLIHSMPAEGWDVREI